MQSQRNVLVVSAHADDHIACAGTILKLKQQGFTPFEAILTDSSEGRDFRSPGTDSGVAEMRDDEFSEASRFLGMQRVFRLAQPDLGLMYSKELMLKLAGVIREVRPTVGIIHAQFDWHPDHRMANQIGSEAFKWAATGVRPELGAAWRTPIVLLAEGMLPIEPNIFIDVTEFAEQKMQLWQIYESQAREQAVSFERSLMQVRGYHLRRPGSTMAEAFCTDPTSPIILFD